MSDQPLKLVTKNESAAERVRELLGEVLEKATAEDCIAMASVIVRKDGSSFIAPFGDGSRVLLLGAVTDLQHTIAKDGDAS